jgi:hypothetical protein
MLTFAELCKDAALQTIVAFPSSSSSSNDTPVNDIPYNKYSGYLLRVKPQSSDEGGVAAGYSVLSAPALV